MGFIEKLMKECVLSYDFSKAELMDESADDLFGSNPCKDRLWKLLMDF